MHPLPMVHLSTLNNPWTTHENSSLPHARRGTYRVSPAKWFAPEAIKPPAGSTKQAATGRVVSALARASASPGVHEATIEVPSQLAPLSLAFQLAPGGGQQQGKGQELSSLGQPFAVPVGMGAGRVAPMGAHLTGNDMHTAACDKLDPMCKQIFLQM